MDPKLNCRSQIRNQMISAPKGTVFALGDFVACGPNTAVRVALSVLTKEGLCKRLFHGIYYCPSNSSDDENDPGPNPADVAEALARNHGWKIAPSGRSAQFALGLLPEAPKDLYYTSTGADCQHNINGVSIVMTHSDCDYLKKMSCASAMVVNALRATSHYQIEQSVLETIARNLNDTEYCVLLSEKQYAPKWLQPYIEQIGLLKYQTMLQSHSPKP